MRVFLLLLLLTVAGCAGKVVRPSPDGGLAGLERREEAISRRPAWSFGGRVAISQADTTGSGRIEWQQQAEDFRIRLSSALAGQSWEIERSGGLTRITGADGRVVEAQDPEAALLEMTGWQLPLEALSYWVRGLRAPGLAPADVGFDASGRLAKLEQGGWTIDYRDWFGQMPELPRRVFADKDGARVRLVIERWE